MAAKTLPALLPVLALAVALLGPVFFVVPQAEAPPPPPGVTHVVPRPLDAAGFAPVFFFVAAATGLVAVREA